MDFIFLYVFFIVILCMYLQRRRRIHQIIRKHIKMKKGKGIINMNELMHKYIGKEVIIYTGLSSVSGTLTKIEDSWAELETATGSQILNLEYISRIREYPRNKKGKKSSLRAIFEE